MDEEHAEYNILVVALRLCQQQDRSYLTQLLHKASRRESTSRRINVMGHCK